VKNYTVNNLRERDQAIGETCSISVMSVQISISQGR